MRKRNRRTYLVMPLDLAPTPPDAVDDSELDWCFEDPELTRQLRAVQQGRGWLLMTVASALVALAVVFAL